MDTIKFRRVLCVMVLAPGFMVMGGCQGGSSTVPQNLTAAGAPQATAPTPAPAPIAVPAPAPIAAPAPAPIAIAVPAPTGNSNTTVSWNAPALRVNGTAISFGEIAGYKIYYGTLIGNYPYVINVADRAATTYQLSGLAPNTTYYVVVRPYDTAGREGANSNVVTKVL